MVTHIHPPTLQGFCADANFVTLKCWWVVGGVGSTAFRDSPYEDDFILVTQIRAIICCLLILFTTQSGSCTLRPPRLHLCCFPLHRRQMSSDITYSPISSIATKTQPSKGLAWRLNKSACNPILATLYVCTMNIEACRRPVRSKATRKIAAVTTGCMPLSLNILHFLLLNYTARFDHRPHSTISIMSDVAHI